MWCWGCVASSPHSIENRVLSLGAFLDLYLIIMNQDREIVMLKTKKGTDEIRRRLGPFDQPLNPYFYTLSAKAITPP